MGAEEPTVKDKTLKLLREKPEYEEILQNIVDHENKYEYPRKGGFDYLTGWQIRHIEGLSGGHIPTLLKHGIIKYAYKSSQYKEFKLADREQVKAALEEQRMIKAESVKQPHLLKPSPTEEDNERFKQIPFDLFDDVVGYDDVKELFMKGLEAGKIHFLLVGPPASAKTLLLLCLEKLLRARYVLGSRMTKAGLTDYLITHQPKFLLLDEVDRLSGPDYGVLLSLCETGRVTEMVYGKTREETLDITVFACCNRLKGIPEEVLSRFQVLKFEPYTREQFIDIVENVLVRRGMPEDLALYIAKAVWDQLDSHDPRQAIRIGRLANTREDVERLIEILKKYSA